MSETQVELSVDGMVATATLSTEAGLNVLSASVLDRIAEVSNEVRKADGVRFLVLAAKGKVFLAGANIKELSALDTAGAVAISQRGNRAFDAIAELPCITISRLHGATLGGGLELAMACDFRIAVSSAKVGLPEASLGLIPGWKGISRLGKLAGLNAAKRLVFSAAMIDATEAHRLGIVDQVVADEAALDAAIAKMIAGFKRGGPYAVAMAKRAILDGDETVAFAACFDHPQAREGMSAFVDKRAASWMEG